MDKSTKKKTEAGSAPVKNSPVWTHRIEDMNASIFAREHNGTTYYSWTLSRSYVDANGARRYTSSLNSDDTGKVAELAKRVSEAVRELQSGK